jgi:drug/metabolite transporter (DMT)-like permease
MKTKTLIWFLFIFLSLTWGSSFILMKKSMFPVADETMVFGPFQVGALRVFLAGFVLLPIAYRFRKKLTRKTFWLLLVTGVFGNLMPAMMFTIAQTNIDSSLAGLLNMGTSFFVVLIGIFFYKSKPSFLQLLGLTLGSVGLYLVLSGQLNAADNKDIRYAFFIFPATLGYAISLTTIKFKLQDLPPTAITSLSFSLILIPAFVICLITDAFSPILQAENGLRAFGFISILGIVGTAIAVLLFTKLISIANHIFASAVAYMLPVVAIFIGRLDGEDFPWINYIWVAIIVVGVFLMNKSKKNTEQLK